MPSIGSILAVARTGLQVQQQAINVTAHNLANASTEGYARQRVDLASLTPVHTSDGVFGTGATVVDVERVADALLDAVYRREVSASTEQETRADLASRVEAILGEPSNLGLGSTLGAFFSAFSELAADPSSGTIRTVVRQNTQNLVDKLHELAGNLDDVRQDVEARLTTAVSTANALLADIGRLNQQIVTVEGDGVTAGDLRDARERLLNDLAELAPVKVTERANGGVGVTLAGVSVVDGAYPATLELRTAGGVTSLAVVGRPGSLSAAGGATGGLLTVSNTDLPDLRQGLDDLAAALVDRVNTIHATGTNPRGDTGVDFFDATGVTATSIGLSAAVLADAQAIAAGTADGAGSYRAGASDVAEVVAGLRDTDVAALGDTVLGHYRGLVTTVGQAVRSSSDSAETHGILADQARKRRDAVSGVSVDEELVRMIQFQTAYQAAARVVTTADEMMQSLLAM